MRLLILILLTFSTGSVFAQEGSLLPTELEFDFNGDKVMDTVKLLPPAAGSDYRILEISLSSKTGLQRIENSKLAYAYANPGASLELRAKGSFKVTIDHSGFGRSSYMREYTISFRDEKFLLSGVTVSEYDKLDPSLGGSCDFNLLTGKGVRNRKPMKIKGQKIELSSASFDWLPAECKFQ